MSLLERLFGGGPTSSMPRPTPTISPVNAQFTNTALAHLLEKRSLAVSPLGIVCTGLRPAVGASARLIVSPNQNYLAFITQTGGTPALLLFSTRDNAKVWITPQNVSLAGRARSTGQLSTGIGSANCFLQYAICLAASPLCSHSRCQCA